MKCLELMATSQPAIEKASFDGLYKVFQFHIVCMSWIQIRVQIRTDALSIRLSGRTVRRAQWSPGSRYNEF